MDSVDNNIWDAIGRLPLLLHEYSGFSYPVLILLFIGGAILLAVLLWRKSTGDSRSPLQLLALGGLLMFLSASGFILKWYGGVEAQRLQQAFIAQHRAPDDEHWLLIFDFSLPSDLDEQQRAQQLDRMNVLVSSITEVLLESMPTEFAQPRVVHIPTGQSPWQAGIGPENFDDVIQALNAFEVMWGNIHNDGRQAKAFLGISRQLAHDFDTMIPLKDFSLNEDLRRELQVGDGYYRLLGLVTMGMALDTYQRASQASGEERKALMLKAVEQLTQARARVSNKRDDPVLKRNLFSPRVDTLIDQALADAGISR